MPTTLQIELCGACIFLDVEYNDCICSHQCRYILVFGFQTHSRPGFISIFSLHMYASKQVSLKLLPPLTTYYVKLCLTAYNEEKMFSYPNSELCISLGDLHNRCKSTSINSSQIYPPLNNSIYDSMCNEEWSELMCNLRITRWVVCKKIESAHLYSFTFLGFQSRVF